MAFSTKTTVASQTRYSVGKTLPTAENGRVGVGADRNGREFLVHEVGRTTEAVALHAVASAIAGGIISPSEVVAAYRETGKLAQLKSEIGKG